MDFCSSLAPLSSSLGWLLRIDEGTHTIELYTFILAHLKFPSRLDAASAKALGAALIAAANKVEKLPPRKD